MKSEPRTLLEAIRYFADLAVAHDLLVQMRWPKGVCCPTCGRTDVRYIATRRVWECKEKHPKKQFSARVGTLLEDSPLPLDKWFAGTWMIANCKNGISSYEFSRAAGITQKSALFLLHRIRLAMKAGSITKIDGEVETNETFIGGRSKNMHKAKRAKAIKGTGGAGKAAVVGILRRTTKRSLSKINAAHVPNVQRKTLHEIDRKHVAAGACLYTDALKASRGLSPEHQHQHEVVDHAVEYVRGRVIRTVSRTSGAY